MRKGLKILPVLFTMPCLMANALGPSNYYSDYRSLSIDYVSSTQVEGTYYHTYRLYNYGNGYVDSVSIRYGEEGTYDNMILGSDNISNTFANALYGPGYGNDIVVTSTYPIVNTTASVGYSARAYKQGSYYALKEIKGIKYVGTNDNVYSNFTYIYEVEFQMSHNRDAIIRFDYDGNDLSVVCKTSGGSDHRIYTNKEIDIEKISVKEFFFIEPHVAFKIDDDALTRAMWIFIAGFLFLASLIVFPAVFIPAMVRRSRRKKMKATK